jgi:hypothetical protein
LGDANSILELHNLLAGPRKRVDCDGWRRLATGLGRSKKKLEYITDDLLSSAERLLVQLYEIVSFVASREISN